MARRPLAAVALALTVMATATTTTTTAADICGSDAFAALQPTTLGTSPLELRALVVADQICLEFAFSSDALRSDPAWFAVGLAPEALMVSDPATNVMVFRKDAKAPVSHVIHGRTVALVTKEPDQSFFQVHEPATAPLRFRYQRALAKRSPHDVAIDAMNEATFIWAYGATWPLAGHSAGAKGIATYHFPTTMSADAMAQSETGFCVHKNCPAIIGGAAFVLMTLGGVLVTVLLKRTALGHAVMYKTLVDPPMKSTTNDPIPGIATMVMQTLADLLVGEILVMLIFFSAVATLVLLHRQQAPEVITGHVALLVLMFLILPVSRISLWTILFGSSFERIVKFHRWLGLTLSIASIVHVVFASQVVALTSRAKYKNVVPLYGLVALVSFLAMTVLANEYMRRKLFDIFYMSHRVLSTVGFVFVILHSVEKVGFALAVPLGLYVLGLMLQWVQQYSFLHPTKVLVNEASNTTTLILMASQKTAHYAQTMNHCAYFCVQVPSVSGLQWHPFSAIVTPNGDSIGFCMRVLGSFTRQLLEQARQSHSLGMRVSGPYGNLSVDVDQYDVVLMIAGGVGVTPLLSVMNQRRLFPVKQSRAMEWNMLWSVRHPQDLLMVDALMPSQGQMEFASSMVGPKDPYLPAPPSNPAYNMSWHCNCSDETKDGFVVRENGEHLKYRGGILVLDEYINSSRYMGRKVAVLVCGPPTMIVEAQTLARKCGFDLHKEIFDW